MSSADETTAAGYNKWYYLAIWTGILRDFLGWSSEQVFQWAQSTFGTALDRDYDLVYHASPQYWIVNLLIPSQARSKLQGLPLVHLHQALEHAFWDERYPHYTFPPDMDWTPYKGRVTRVLQEHLGSGANE